MLDLGYAWGVQRRDVYIRLVLTARATAEKRGFFGVFEIEILREADLEILGMYLSFLKNLCVVQINYAGYGGLLAYDNSACLLQAACA